MKYIDEFRDGEVARRLAGAIQAWADFKADHRVVSRGLGVLHLSGILLGGGTAILPLLLRPR